MRFRTFVAMLLLVGHGTTSVEVVVGELRDGEVHHESVVAAAEHHANADGEHGHEEPGDDAEHGPDHQHGTAGDHCTHTHSVSLPTGTAAFFVVTDVRSIPAPALPTQSGVFKAPLFHPPKA